MRQEYPQWFDGRKVNEILFCEEFLKAHPMKCIRGRFFTVDGLVEDEDVLKMEIYNAIKYFVTENVAKAATRLVEALKLACFSPPLSVQTDRIHVANGTFLLDGRFTPEKEFCMNRLKVAYNPSAPIPAHWLSFLEDLLYPEDIPTMQEYLGYCLIPSNKAQKMLILTGNGGEGKSRIGLVMRSLMGDNMNTGSIQKVETSPFARADLPCSLHQEKKDLRVRV